MKSPSSTIRRTARRLALPFATALFTAIAPRLPAQIAPAVSSAKAVSTEDPITLSPFEVRAADDGRYLATTSGRDLDLV